MKKLHITCKTGNKKGTVLFIHGSSSSSRVFDHVMQSSRLPYKLISFDLPGHGKSWRSEDETEYSITAYKKTILEVISGEEEVLLVGHSFGGHLALEMLNEIKTLKGLVIFGTPPVKIPINTEEAFLYNPVVLHYHSKAVADKDLDATLDNVVQTKSVIPLIKEDFKVADPAVRSVLAKEIAGGGLQNEYELFRKIRVLKYILHAKEENMVNLDYVKKMIEESEGEVDFYD